MEEKYEAIWVNIEEDGSAKIIFEIYLPKLDKLHMIYQHANGAFMPYSYIEESDPQWRLPVWSKENDKSMIPTLELAKEYLVNYGTIKT